MNTHPPRAQLGRLAVAAAALALCGCSHCVVFTSDTKVGLDLSQSANQSPEFAFGYKRSALVIMPTKSQGDASATNDCYSVLADAAVRWKWGTLDTNSGVRVSQIMATGFAARNLANNGQIGRLFGQSFFNIYNQRFTNVSPQNGAGQ